MNKKLILYTFVAALGGLLFGFDTAVINGAMPFFKQHFDLTGAMLGWAVSSALIGCVIGAIAIGRPGDVFGRRLMLKLMALLFLISAIGTGLSFNLTMFVISVLSVVWLSVVLPYCHRHIFQKYPLQLIVAD